MTTKPPEKKFCVICETFIQPAQPAHDGHYNIKGHVKKAWVHERCGWMEGLKALIEALNVARIAKLQADKRTAGEP